jgi:hypothetical protein
MSEMKLNNGKVTKECGFNKNPFLSKFRAGEGGERRALGGLVLDLDWVRTILQHEPTAVPIPVLWRDSMRLGQQTDDCFKSPVFGV